MPRFAIRFICNLGVQTEQLCVQDKPLEMFSFRCVLVYLIDDRTVLVGVNISSVSDTKR